MNLELNELKNRLASRAEDVCRHLLPNGRLKGEEWCVGSLDGETGESLKVNCGTKSGIWKDFASGDGGDNLLELWHRVSRHGDFGATVSAARSFLGIGDTTRIQKSIRRSKPKVFTKPKAQAQDQHLQEGGSVWQYLTETRQITPATLKTYSVKEGIVYDDNQQRLSYVLQYRSVGGNLEHLKRVAIERSSKGKKRIQASAGSRLGLFGKDVVGESGEEILIAEGEIDAMSWYQSGIPALSVPNGAKSHTWLENDYDFLDGFDRILIAFDSDEDGRNGAEELAKRVGIERAFLIELEHYNDANEALQADDARALLEAYENPRSLQPDELCNAAEYLDAAGQILDGETQAGIPVSFTSDWRVRPHELTIWTGFSGHGKSVMLSQMVGELCELEERAVIASLEQPVPMTLADFIRQRTREPVPPPQVRQGLESWLADHLWFYDHVGVQNWKDILIAFRYAWKRFGCTQFVIDGLLRCGIREDDYDGQKQFVEALADFVNQFPVHIHLVAHSRKRDDESNPPGKLDVRGAGAITDQCHNGITIWRNKAKAHAIEEAQLGGDIELEGDLRLDPDAKFIMWKQRKTGEEPCSLLMFDPSIKLFIPKT